MKALATQFDGRRLSHAVATPTCSSCCCCCCCLATSIASSTLLAQRIAKEGERHQVPDRHLLTTLAALFIPVVGLLVYFGFWSINRLFRSCTEHVYDVGTSSLMSQPSYTICTNPASTTAIPLAIGVAFAVLAYLYFRVHVPKPFARAALVTVLIAVAFAGEVFGGAALILTGFGGIFYLIMIPIVVGWITVWYHRHLSSETDDTLGGPTTARILSIEEIDEPAMPRDEEPKSESNDTNPTIPTPPTSGAW